VRPPTWLSEAHAWSLGWKSEVSLGRPKGGEISHAQRLRVIGRQLRQAGRSAVCHVQCAVLSREHAFVRHMTMIQVQAALPSVPPGWALNP